MSAMPVEAQAERRARRLSCVGVTKNFGGVRAVQDLSFSVEPTEVFGIAGPNGAGKTSLFNVVSGHSPVDAGRVMLGNVDVTTMRPDGRFRLGIARTFQQPQVFGSQTVLHNALVGAYFSGRFRALGLKFPSEAVERALQALEQVGLADARNQVAGSLSVYGQKRLMIASAMASLPSILMLDEPFGGLNRGEMDELEELIRVLNSSGTTIVVIEHVLKALFSLSARVLIMHHGEEIYLGAPSGALRDARVITSYLGERVERRRRRASGVGPTEAL